MIPLERPRYTSAMMFIRMLMWANERTIHSLTEPLGTGPMISVLCSTKYRPDNELFTAVADKRMADILCSAMDKCGVFQEFEEDVERVLGPFKNYLDVNCKYILQPRMKICPKCIESARHYIFHQIAFLDECPVCGEKLLTVCPRCGENNPLLPYAQRVEGPLVCTRCGEALSRFSLPEEMFASYYDDNSIAFDVPDHREHILILSTDPLDEKPFEQEALNEFLRGYYLNGMTPKANIRLRKSALKEMGKVDIAAKAYGLIDDVMGTDTCKQYTDNKGKCYNAMRKNLNYECAKEESFEAQAAMKLFEKSISGKESNRLKGYYLRASFANLQRQVALAGLSEQHGFGILDAIGDDWVRRVYEHSLEYLKEKNPYGSVQINCENIPTPHFIYVVLETERNFDVVVLPGNNTYSMTGEPVKNRKSKGPSYGKVHNFYRGQKYGDISSRIVRAL